LREKSNPARETETERERESSCSTVDGCVGAIGDRPTTRYRWFPSSEAVPEVIPSEFVRFISKFLGLIDE
jgi:hypothetical protein